MAEKERRHGLIVRQYSISCICRAVYGKHDSTRREGDYHKPMDNPNGEDTQTVFNNPANHWADFDYGDMIL